MPAVATVTRQALDLSEKASFPRYKTFVKLASKPPKERSSTDVSTLAEILRHLPYFEQNRLTTLQRRQIASHMRFKTYRTAFSTVFSEGSEGRTFYIIVVGAVSVCVAQQGVGVKEVARLGAGMSFGELALFHHRFKRSATVTTTCATQLLELTLGDYNTCLRSIHEKALTDKESFLRNVPFLENLSDEEVQQLARVTHVRRYAVGSVLAEQGTFVDNVKFFSIVKVGQVDVLRRAPRHAGMASGEAAPLVRLARLSSYDVPTAYEHFDGITDHAARVLNRTTVVAATIVEMAYVARFDLVARIKPVTLMNIQYRCMRTPSGAHVDRMHVQRSNWQEYKKELVYDITTKPDKSTWAAFRTVAERLPLRDEPRLKTVNAVIKKRNAAASRPSFAGLSGTGKWKAAFGRARVMRTLNPEAARDADIMDRVRTGALETPLQMALKTPGKLSIDFGIGEHGHLPHGMEEGTGDGSALSPVGDAGAGAAGSDTQAGTGAALSPTSTTAPASTSRSAAPEAASPDSAGEGDPLDAHSVMPPGVLGKAMWETGGQGYEQQHRRHLELMRRDPRTTIVKNRWEDEMRKSRRRAMVQTASGTTLGRPSTAPDPSTRQPVSAAAARSLNPHAMARMSREQLYDVMGDAPTMDIGSTMWSPVLAAQLEMEQAQRPNRVGAQSKAAAAGRQQHKARREVIERAAASRPPSATLLSRDVRHAVQSKLAEGKDAATMAGRAAAKLRIAAAKRPVSSGSMRSQRSRRSQRSHRGRRRVRAGGVSSPPSLSPKSRSGVGRSRPSSGSSGATARDRVAAMANGFLRPDSDTPTHRHVGESGLSGALKTITAAHSDVRERREQADHGPMSPLHRALGRRPGSATPKGGQLPRPSSRYSVLSAPEAAGFGADAESDDSDSRPGTAAANFARGGGERSVRDEVEEVLRSSMTVHGS